MITSNPSTWPSGDLLWTVCQAIAHAEGAGIPGAAPDRYNNPGDLSKGDEHGQAVAGYTRLPDGEDLIVFASKEAGWNALYAKLSNILNGRSTAYTPQMSWTEIAQKYAGDWRTWVKNVTDFLQVSPADKFADYFSAEASPGSAGPAPGAP